MEPALPAGPSGPVNSGGPASSASSASSGRPGRPVSPPSLSGHPVSQEAVTALLLDVDDTLLDTRAAFRAGIAAVIPHYLAHLDEAQQHAAALHWARDPGGHFRAFTRGELDFREQRRRRAADLHSAFGAAPLDEPDYLEWEERYEEGFTRGQRVHPDALALLAALEATGVPFGAVTNATRAYTSLKLDRLGLAERVPLLVTVDTLGIGKPDPRVFALGCERLGVDPARTAYVGDEVDIDARAARDAGLLGIWLDRHRTGADPGDVPAVRDLRELPALLPGLFGSGTPSAGELQRPEPGVYRKATGPELGASRDA